LELFFYHLIELFASLRVGLSNASTFQVSSFSAPASASAAAQAHCPPIGCQLQQCSTAQKVDFTQRTGTLRFVLPQSQFSYRLTFLALHLTDLSYSKKIIITIYFHCDLVYHIIYFKYILYFSIFS
jgi:hypothetical protein